MLAVEPPRRQRAHAALTLGIIVALSVAVLAMSECDGGPVTQYDGTVMNDATPDSSVRVSAIFWSHDDTSFTGSLHIGAPFTFGGSAYAWHEDGALRIVTVSPRGDTVLWSSRTTDDSIGGRYIVLGGASKHSGGTWRAGLTKGLPLAPATLRARERWLVPIGACVGLAIYAAMLAIAIRWLRRSKPPVLDPTTTSAFNEHSRGISGWLAFFVLGQAVTVVFTATRFPHFLSLATGPTWDLGRVASMMHPLITLELLALVTRFVAPLAGLYLIFTRSRYAPRFYFAFLVSLAVFAAFDIVGALWLQSQTDAVIRNGALPSTDLLAERSRAQADNLRQAFFGIIWAAYWARSVRVQLTFGSKALDEPPPAQPTAISPSPIPEAS